MVKNNSVIMEFRVVLLVCLPDVYVWECIKVQETMMGSDSVQWDINKWSFDEFCLIIRPPIPYFLEQ